MSGFDLYGANPNQPPSHWISERLVLVNQSGNVYESGKIAKSTSEPFNYLYVNEVQRICRLWVGSGKRYFIGALFPGQRRFVRIPTAVSEIHIEWDATPNPTPYNLRFVPFVDLWLSDEPSLYTEGIDLGERLGWVFVPDPAYISNFGPADEYQSGGGYPLVAQPIHLDRLPLNAPFTVSIPVLVNTDVSPGLSSAGNATGPKLGSVVDLSLVAAMSPYARWGTDLAISNEPRSIVRGTQRALTATYSVPFRTGARPFTTGIAALANSRNPIATIWNGGSNRILWLHKVDFCLYGVSAATQLMVELVRIDTAAPTGGTNITGRRHDTRYSNPDSGTRYVPTAASVSEVGSTGIQPLYYNLAGAFAPAQPLWETMYDDHFPEAAEPLTSLINGGYAIIADTTAAVTITGLARMTFSEQPA